MRSQPRSPSPGRAVRTFAVDGWTDPVDAFAALYTSASHSIWLDAGAGATTGMSYLAAAHPGSRFVTASRRSGSLTESRPLSPGDTPVTTPGSLFDFLRTELTLEGTAPGDGAAVGFRLGWVGWFGYGLATAPGSLPPQSGLTHESPADAPPDAAFLFVDRVIAFDHAARTVTLLARSAPPEESNAELPGARESDADVDAWVLDTRRRLTAAGPTAAPAAPATPAVSVDGGLEVHWRHSATHYAGLIGACQARIAAGDAYQLCLTNEVTVAGRFDPAEVYRRLRTGSPSHHGGLLRFGEHALLSASPEEFLSVTPGGHLRTRPIKGTRPRSGDPLTDGMLRAELLASDKERAENLMIVDLMRNDLGRVAALGSVAVTALLQVEGYPHVHQLVSTVEARLAAGLTAVDAIEACFPAGSMTGAPKASAMRILRALEDGDRGVYAGAFGYLGLDGAVDLAMVIRSIVLWPGGASIGTGGGITALSDAAEEIEETRVKARALIDVIRASSPVPAR